MNDHLNTGLILVVEHNPAGLPPEPSLEEAERILAGSDLELVWDDEDDE